MHGKRPPDNQMSPPLDLVSGPCSLFQIGICRYVQLLVHVRVSSLVLCKPWHIGEPSMLCLAWLTFLDIRVFLLPASSQNLLCCDFVLLHPWIGLLYDRLGSFLRVLGSPLSGHLPCLNCWVEVGLVARVTDLDSNFFWIVESMSVLWQGLVLGDNESHLY